MGGKLGKLAACCYQSGPVFIHIEIGCNLAVNGAVVHVDRNLSAAANVATGTEGKLQGFQGFSMDSGVAAPTVLHRITLFKFQFIQLYWYRGSERK